MSCMSASSPLRARLHLTAQYKQVLPPHDTQTHKPLAHPLPTLSAVSDTECQGNISRYCWHGDPPNTGQVTLAYPTPNWERFFLAYTGCEHVYLAFIQTFWHIHSLCSSTLPPAPMNLTLKKYKTLLNINLFLCMFACGLILSKVT